MIEKEFRDYAIQIFFDEAREFYLQAMTLLKELKELSKVQEDRSLSAQKAGSELASFVDAFIRIFHNLQGISSKTSFLGLSRLSRAAENLLLLEKSSPSLKIDEFSDWMARPVKVLEMFLASLTDEGSADEFRQSGIQEVIQDFENYVDRPLFDKKMLCLILDEAQLKESVSYLKDQIDAVEVHLFDLENRIVTNQNIPAEEIKKLVHLIQRIGSASHFLGLTQSKILFCELERIFTRNGLSPKRLSRSLLSTLKEVLRVFQTISEEVSKNREISLPAFQEIEGIIGLCFGLMRRERLIESERQIRSSGDSLLINLNEEVVFSGAKFQPVSLVLENLSEEENTSLVFQQTGHVRSDHLLSSDWPGKNKVRL